MTVWEVCLHTVANADANAVANVVVLADYEGAFLVWCQHYNHDIRELLAVIVRPECPHPEGRTVAGKVAICQRDRHHKLPTATATPR